MASFASFFNGGCSRLAREIAMAETRYGAGSRQEARTFGGFCGENTKQQSEGPERDFGIS
jgi:hypothetical protein